MAVKILMNWDIKAGRNDEYFEFIVREWVPTVTRLGIQPTGAWFTVYSREVAPVILAECLTESAAKAHEVFKSADWERLQTKLSEFVMNYSHRVVPARGDFQL
jgi:hypothetical protein